MSIESEIFKKYIPDFDKIKEFGFINKNGKFIFDKLFRNGEFKAVIELLNSENIRGTVYDMENGDEFLPLKIESQQGAFVGEIRDEYKKILENIRDNCFIEKYFIFPQTNRISDFMIKKYCNKPVFMWEKFPNYGVFKNPKNNKWYALVGDIKRSKLDLNQKDETVEIINIKLDAEKIQLLLKEKKTGFYPAYHMNKKTWITIVLDETLSDETVLDLVDESYLYTIK